MVCVQAASDQTTVELKLSQGTRRYDYAYQVLDLVNQERAKKNLSPVTMDKNLLECAMTRAEELTVYASHNRPNGSSCFSAFPYFADPSENLAINQSTLEEVMETWVKSSGHYANIINSSNVSAGIGCYSQNGHLYWIQCFTSHKAETCTQPANQNVSPVISALPDLVDLHFDASSPVLKFHDRTLAEGKDYAISFSNNQNSGLGSFTITGLGFYSGTLTSNFFIRQVSLTQANIAFSQSSYLYTGTALTPKPAVTWNGMTLTENVDYTLSWHDNERQGNAYVTVSGMGNFTGVRNKYFYIDLTPITEAEIGDIPDYEYAPGKEFKPEPTVTLNGVTLKKDVDYTLSYSNNTMASSRTNRPRVNITGIGIYRSGFSKYFTINPLKLSSETIQLPNTNYGNESVTTYLRNNLIITYNGTKLTSDDFTITSVRCSASNEILDFSLSYKQNYSGTRQMTSVKLCNFSNIPEQIFKGAAVTPKPVVKYGSSTLQEGTDYILSWADNTKTGRAK